MVSRALATFAAFALAASLALSAQAQDATQARALFERGRASSAAEQWVEALDLFQRSRAIVERPGTVFNIAAVLVRLGRAREAMEAIDRFLAIADVRRDAAMRATASTLRTTAEASLRHVVLRVSPDAARVEVDGQPVDSSGTLRSLLLDPGAHSIAVSLDGHETARFDLAPGDDAREVTLRPRDGTLVVRSSVPTATIAIDGEGAGIGQAERTVAPGPHQVALAAEGYLGFLRTVEISPGERALVEAALDPEPQRHSVLASPVFWGLTAGGVAVIVVSSILIALATASTDAPYGGSSNVVLAP